MGSLGWNEIQRRASNFVYEWKGTTEERAEAQSFLNDFLYVFGVNRRRVAFFENKVEKANGNKGYIDMLWKGKILVEMKSLGKDLNDAYNQGFRYMDGLKDYELPQYIMICDFENIHLYNLDNKKIWRFKLEELPQKVRLFGFLAGYNETNYEELLPLNQVAAEQMGLLHDELKNIGYNGHKLEVYLVRLLFCLFAENTTLFRPRQFYDYIADSKEDGRDLAQKLDELFQTLNTPVERRLTTLDEELLEFPYVNGKLFEEILPIAGFNSEMRERLLQSCMKDWSAISPAIFGSMFQSIMNPEERRHLGAHYTSEENIMKVIKSLFLDDLWKIYEENKNNKKQLGILHKYISSLTFLDPACGCGNFLVVTYRELRRLELKILQITHNQNNKVVINFIRKVNVGQFYGIECEEFPAQIAKVAMWLIDHQMNLELSNVFGEYVDDLPLSKYANIVCENAITYNWENLIEPKDLNYILGNPPFIGAALMDRQQKNEIANLFGNITNVGKLDYVTAWYKKSVDFIQNTKIEVALVSTNSICQGEQVLNFWRYILENYCIYINFAHNTFQWKNEAPNVAGVHCIVVGFASFEKTNKYLFKYETPNSNPTVKKVKNINSYLVEGSNIIISSRRNPLSDVPKMLRGNSPVDNGEYILDLAEKEELELRYPELKPYIKKYIGAREYINQRNRYCLWLVDISPKLIQKIPELKEKIENVRKFRLKSKKEATRRLADFPTLFESDRYVEKDYVLIPRHSSERRRYIPIGFMDKDTIPSDAVQVIPDADIYHFSILTSKMHMIWTSYICGRLKNDFRYSNIVYNNFVFPDVTQEEKKEIEKCGNLILDIRNLYKESSLAELYDPLTMPPKLLKAHQKLDKVVDKAYGCSKFKNDSDRMALLFEMYEELTNNNSEELAYS